MEVLISPPNPFTGGQEITITPVFRRILEEDRRKVQTEMKNTGLALG